MKLRMWIVEELQWALKIEEWSGLSESNRHLNLGKVPYYHYTKAASGYNFYSTLPAATTRHPRNRKKIKDESGNLGDARGFYDRRAALAFGKAGGFFLVGINPAKSLAVGVIDGDQEMMVFSAAIFSEFRLSVPNGLPGAFR